MRRFTVILFSLFLLYAEAAQALGPCLGDDRHHDHPFKGDHSASHGSVTHDHSVDVSWPIIHCPPEERLGPAIQAGSAQLTHPDKVMWVHPSFLTATASFAFSNSLWLEALFKRILTFSLPHDLARYLLLSTLQI
jgi:hypothetical protein